MSKEEEFERAIRKLLMNYYNELKENDEFFSKNALAFLAFSWITSSRLTELEEKYDLDHYTALDILHKVQKEILKELSGELK